MDFFKAILPIFIGILLVGCGPNYIFEEEKALASGAWTYADTLTFDFNIVDTTKVYNLYLEVDHSTGYRFQNLYVKIKTKFPKGNQIEQTVSLELANKFGLWLGDCGSENCEIIIPIQEQVYFQESGEYRIILEQFMRENPLKKLNSFGVKIEETDLKKE